MFSFCFYYKMIDIKDMIMMNLMNSNKDNFIYVLILMIIINNYQYIYNVVTGYFRKMKYSYKLEIKIEGNEDCNSDEFVEYIEQYFIRNKIKVENMANYENYSCPISSKLIELEKDIYFKGHIYERTEKERIVNVYVFELFSNELKSWELCKFVKKMKTYHDNESRSNTEKFIITCSTKTSMSTKHNSDNEDKVTEKIEKLIFKIYKNKTEKTFDKLFFEQKDDLLKRLDRFMNDSDYYKRNGKSRNLGLLLYGKPGCGKTSTIKAISHYTNKHLIEISLKDIKSFTSLQDIFYSEEFDCPDDREYRSRRITNDRKIIILEDVDCCGLARSEDEDEENNGITLANILNIIDGIIEQPGRILIMSTNYPEKLDPALLRAGRIDMKIEFTTCTRKMIEDIAKTAEIVFNSEQITEFLKRNITPAELYNEIEGMIN